MTTSYAVSHKLIVRDDGQAFIVSGSPTVGYTCAKVADTIDLGHYKRSWQAVETARLHEADVEPLRRGIGSAEGADSVAQEADRG
jgi:hypothetical protein